MSGNLKALRKVADLDSQIMKLEERRRQIPELIRTREAGLEQTSRQLAAKDAEIKTLRVKTEIKEKEYQGAEQTVIKLRDQINQAKSNKEFQALQHEILSKEADNARLEDAVLAQMQKVDREKEAREAIAAQLAKAESEAAAERTKLEKELALLEAQCQKLVTQRNEAGKDVPPDIFAKYERLIARRGQTAMVGAVNGSCQGCFMTLRPETMAQLRKGGDLVFCHSCSRILYLEEDQP